MRRRPHGTLSLKHRVSTRRPRLTPCRLPPGCPRPRRAHGRGRSRCSDPRGYYWPRRPRQRRCLRSQSIRSLRARPQSRRRAGPEACSGLAPRAHGPRRSRRSASGRVDRRTWGGFGTRGQGRGVGRPELRPGGGRRRCHRLGRERLVGRGHRLARCVRFGSRTYRRRREEPERVDVAFRVDCKPHPQVNVGLGGGGVGARAAASDDLTLHDRGTSADQRLGELEQRDRIPVNRLDRHRAPAVWE